MRRFFKSAAFPILLVVILAFIAQRVITNDPGKEAPSYTQLVNPTSGLIAKGKVETATINNKDFSLDIKEKNGESFSTGYPANTSREEAHCSHGLPFPGNSLKIVDPLSGIVLPVGDRGEIAVKGPTLMLGYLGIPLDETLDEEGYFRTGDGGYVDEAGRLFWEGRLNDIIKTGGANVSPLEIDSVIRDCPGVKVTQTVGVPHETLGEVVVACIVPHEGTALDEATVRNFVRDKLASYKVPRRVLFFGEGDLQLTGSAKVKTGDLRNLAAKTLAAERPVRS